MLSQKGDTRKYNMLSSITEVVKQLMEKYVSLDSQALINKILVNFICCNHDIILLIVRIQ